MPLEIIQNASSFRSLRDQWDALSTEPLRSFDWHFAWWESFGQDRELRLYCFRENGILKGIAPFFVNSWLGQKTLCYIGSGKTCTDYAQLIVDPAVEVQFSEAIAKDLYEATHISMVEFDGILSTDRSKSLESELSGSEYWPYERELEPTWVLNLPGSWQEFVGSSKKSLRRKIKKAEKRLGSATVVVRSTLNALPFSEAFEILVELHQERFIGKGEPGVFADQKFHDFLFNATSHLAKRNNAEILIGYWEDDPVVAQLYFHGAEGPQLYQSGVRTSAMKLEPGHLLFTYAVKHAIENGSQTFDFLRGSEPYKPYWGAVPRPLTNVRYVSRKIFPSLVNKAYLFLRETKRRLQFDQLRSSHGLKTP